METKAPFLSVRNDPDVPLFFTVIVLAGFGIAMTYSASAVFANKMFGDHYYFFKRQLVWFALGLGALFVFQNIDYRVYRRYSRLLVGVAIFLLALILVPGLGSAAKGSARWIALGPINIQPSEIAKLFMVIYLARVFSAEVGHNPLAQLLFPMGVLALVFILILLQPDFGTAVDILAVAVIILFVSGFPIFYLVSLAIVSIPAFYLLVYQVDYRRERILGFLDPWKDRFGKGYHIIQSFIAFRKGEFFGTGLGLGTQKIRRLPEPHTDFVFAVIAEEAGFFGTALVILLYLVFFWRGMVIALEAPDDFGRLLAVGLTAMVVIQAFINTGVVSGLLPTTGIPLPFISYGGSSLLTMMSASGILLNISRQRTGERFAGSFDQEVWR